MANPYVVYVEILAMWAYVIDTNHMCVVMGDRHVCIWRMATIRTVEGSLL